MSARRTIRRYAHELSSDSCLEWTVGLTKAGYGRVTANGRRELAHRAAYVAAFGSIPEGMEIDHRCHNRACVLPEHLQAVPHKVNLENRAAANANSSSGVRGVSWDRRRSKWRVSVGHEGRSIFGGYFESLTDASQAAKEKRRELFTNSLADQEGRVS